MRILLTNATPIYSGGELFVLDVARELQSRGHRITVSTQPGHLLAEKCDREGIATAPMLYQEGVGGLRCVTSIGSIIHRNRIDLVHSNSNFDRTYTGFAAFLHGTPHVASVHSQHSISHNPIHWVRNRVAISHFLVDGEPTRKILVEQDGIDAARISVLRLGIDVRELQRDAGRRVRERRRFDIPEDAFVVGNVGRLVPFKGHAVLIDAAREVLARHPSVHFLLVGDGVLQEDLLKHAAEAGISRQFRFAGFSDDLPSVYAAMDLYVHPSLDHGGESFPLAVLQALASGLPAIASRVGDIPMMLDDERGGRLITPGDAQALAGTMMQFIEDDRLRDESGLHAARFIRNHFTTAHMVDQIEEVYGRLRRGS